MLPFILASASPRRKQLFKMMNIPVTVQPSGIEEVMDKNLSPGELVCRLAHQKGADVAAGYSNAFIISADTVVVHQHDVLGKPSDKQGARDMLRRLSGDTHDVFSGVCLINIRDGEEVKTVTFFERTKVTFSALDTFDIDYYINTNSPMDKAGAYGIQDNFGRFFVKKIEGDYYTVVGFPVHSFYQHLKRDFRDQFNQMFSL
ncbi:MAG: septum formation protein Maf [Bacteroidetes bacterium]|jgi:septum formation protein|nr:septum formation protein Maf [Bacteroidota bacterium]